MKTVSKQRLTAQPQFRDSLSHFILVPHKALVHAAILSCDRHHGNTFPGNRPYASARSQWLAVLQPVQRRLRKSTCAARLKSSLEKKGLDENGPRVLESHAFPSPFPFPLENEIAGKNASGIPTPSSKSNCPRTWTAANRSNAAEQFTGGRTSRFGSAPAFLTSSSALFRPFSHRVDQSSRERNVARRRTFETLRFSGGEMEVVDYQMSGFPEINGLDRWLDVDV